MTGRRLTMPQPLRPALALVAVSAVLACRGPTDLPWVDGVVLNPDYVPLAVGQTDTLTAVALDQGTRPLPERVDRITFRVVNPDIVRLEPLGDGRAAVTGLELGSTRVEGTLGRGAGSATVDVQPPGLAGIRIDPDPVTMGYPASSLISVRAYLQDRDGEPMSSEGFRISWTVNDSTVAYVWSASGDRATLRALRVGNTSLTLRVGRFVETAPVVVEARDRQ